MTIKFTNPLHLYRALLRETTYLFDTNARQWSHEYIRSSFRENAPKVQEGRKWKTQPYDPSRVPRLRERQLLKRGRKFLYLLQRANQGYQRQLRNLLQLTYGRKGPRKRALIAPVMQERPENHIRANKPVADSGSSPSKFVTGWAPPQNFLTLLQTQSQLMSHLSMRKQVKLSPSIEKQNRWGKPMPMCRVKNATKKWYAKMASIMMPPVPEQEWKSLQQKALGKEQFKIVRRRPMMKIPPGMKQIEEVELAAGTIVSGLDKPADQKFYLSVMNPHKLTQRFLSRFYAKHILNHTPVALPNPDGKGLVSKWDNGGRNMLVAEQPKDKTQTDALFG